MINDSGIARVLELLENDLTIIAVGTGTAPASTATQLTTELLRKAPSDTFTDGNTIVLELFLDETEANDTLTEIGIFGSSASTASATGELFASSSANVEKDDTQSLTISVEIELQEVV